MEQGRGKMRNALSVQVGKLLGQWRHGRPRRQHNIKMHLRTIVYENES
jgi:hypothetical protein